MKKILHIIRLRIFYIPATIIIGGIFVYAHYGAEKNTLPTTTTVDTGTVQHIVSVSGSIKAIQTADLSFPVSGIIESISVKNGDHVLSKQSLVTLVHNDLKASYQDAYGTLRIAEADRSELITGIRSEARDVTKTKVAIARETLARITKEQDERTQNAYHALLSSSLIAKPDRSDTNETAPIITGTYTCTEGTYTFETFRSGTKSGYSYRLTGLETGTYTAYTEYSAPLGECGLYIQFTEGESYGNSKWIIEIPNTEDSSYVTNKNAYELARTNRENEIRASEQNLELALQNEILDIAKPRNESLSREDAHVTQAQARLAQINAQIQDHILIAPFDGTVTSIDPVVGESVSTEPVITMVADNTFELTVLIPEIDITKVTVGQKANVVFDARDTETLTANIVFVSPLAKMIDGVSYFEATLLFDTEVSWLRGGLNADVTIITVEHTDVLRIPTRFLISENNTYTILRVKGDEVEKVPVTVVFQGNDGYTHIEGLARGEIVVAP